MDLKEVYNKGLQDNRYLSIHYQMACFDELHKELNKAQYISDRVQRQKRMRELFKDKNNPTPIVTPEKTYKELGFKTIQQMEDVRNEGMIYNIEKWESQKRFLELENYVLERFNRADTLANTNKIESQYNAICYLIDQQYTFHTGIFEDEATDFIFSFEYNQFLYDVFQIKIMEIENLDIEPIDETIRKLMKKPLTWNSKKSSIGTLFGMLHDAGIIKGTKADVIRALGAMFSNLSESTLKDNINLKINTNDEKTLYDLETETKAKEWIDYLGVNTTN